MSDRVYENYLSDMTEQNIDDTKRQVLELAVKRFTSKTEASKIILKLDRFKTDTMFPEQFEYFWKKYRTKFKEIDFSKHHEDVARLKEKIGQIEDWDYSTKNTQKVNQYGFDEVDLRPHYNKLREFMIEHPSVSPQYAGSHAGFNEQYKAFFQEYGLYFLGQVSSMKMTKIGKGDKTWDQLRVTLISEQGSVNASMTNWTPEQDQIKIVQEFMQEGDLVIVLLQQNKMEFIDIVPIYTRNGLFSRTSLVANLSKNITYNPNQPYPVKG